jgi:SDR family mycofactocin-dependent oxidoreductase
MLSLQPAREAAGFTERQDGMADRVKGKVAFITGAARGQGRAHAVRLAEEGADIIAVDFSEDIETVPYDLATKDELAETAALVEEAGGRVVTAEADVRDHAALKKALDEGMAEFGRLDIVVANAGILSLARAWEIEEHVWQDMIDVNLTGVWQTCKVTIPTLIDQGEGGSIVLTSSLAGGKGLMNIAHYTAAKHGVVGLMRTLANELAPHMIRVNTVDPNAIDTPMVHSEACYRIFRPDLESPTREDAAVAYQSLNAMPVAWIDSREVSHAVLFLASDEARWVTGARLPVDAGAAIK